MSEVTLIIVHGECMYSVTAHWRKIKVLLAKNPKLVEGKNQGAGYIVLDLNKKLLMNAQDAFVPQLNQSFEVMNIY